MGTDPRLNRSMSTHKGDAESTERHPRVLNFVTRGAVEMHNDFEWDCFVHRERRSRALSLGLTLVSEIIVHLYMCFDARRCGKGVDVTKFSTRGDAFFLCLLVQSELCAMHVFTLTIRVTGCQPTTWIFFKSSALACLGLPRSLPIQLRIQISEG